MKKALLGFFLFIALSSVVACGSIEGENYKIEFTEEQMKMVEFAREDFEAMVDILTREFPFFGVAQRREGQDMNRLFDNFWKELEFSIFYYDITDLERLAGFFQYVAWGNLAYPLNFLAHLNTRAPEHFFNAEAGDRQRAEDGGRIFETKIIEYDRIAYINFSTFLSHYAQLPDSHVRDELFEFIYKVKYYEHLILDIRGNTGGSPRLALDAFIAPNLQKPFSREYLGFFMDTPLFRLHLNHFRLIPNIGFFIPHHRTHIAEDFVSVNALPYMNQDDLQGFDGVIELSHLIYPNNTNYAFAGQIWLLVDAQVFSGAEMFAHSAKITGVMTLVGETTGGSLGGDGYLIASVALPNTGVHLTFDMLYITDAYGRALEEFRTVPHHFNRPGMDALQTVLALIEEGED